MFDLVAKTLEKSCEINFLMLIDTPFWPRLRVKLSLCLIDPVKSCEINFC